MKSSYIKRKVIFFLLLFLCLVTTGVAQVEVRNEPRHHLVFENDFIRVLDVYIAPADTSQYHIHATPSVFIFLSSTAAAQQLWGREPVRNVIVEGKVVYDSLLNPRIHRVWNEDSSWLHVMDVELVKGGSNPQKAIVSHPSYQLLFDEAPVTGYALKLKKGERIQLPVSAAGYLLVSMGDAVITLQSRNMNGHRKMKVGHYEWIDAGNEVALLNKTESATFTL